MLLSAAVLQISKLFTRSLPSEGHSGGFYVNCNTFCANLHFKKCFTWKQREHIKTCTFTLPGACPCAWVARCSLVGTPPRSAFVFQSGVEELHQALSIIRLTCHHCNLPNPREAAGAKTPEVWTAWTSTEGKPQQRGEIEIEKEREGDRWWARMGWKERSGGRVDDGEAVGWQVIVAEGVTEMAGRRKHEQALIFYTRCFLYTWWEASESKLLCSPSSFCNWLYLVAVMSSCGPEW